ncbi:MAG TPA: PAS domain S-box protein [Rhodanobacter sp.]|nr:PAS domain S-box protein [Rhodanobacter sp.]
MSELMGNQGEATFRLLAENNVDLVCWIDLDLVMRYASPSCEQLLGWKPEEMVGRGPDAFVLPDDLPIVAAAHERLVREGMDPFPTVVRMRKKDGTLASMEINARMAKDRASGDPIGIVLTMRDITRRTQREQNREPPGHGDSAGEGVPTSEWERMLHESEERFSKVFGLAPVPMVVFVLDGFRIVDVNDAFIQTTGYARNELVGCRATEVRMLDHTSCRRIERALERESSMQNLPISMRDRKGLPIDCLISAELVIVRGQRCILGAFQDVTERKHSEDELIDALDSVMRDTSWFSRALIEKLAQTRHRKRTNEPSGELADLTTREREVLHLMCEGRSDDEISDALMLSRHTVRNHVSNIYGKIGVHRRGTAIVWARERGVSVYGAPQAHK